MSIDASDTPDLTALHLFQRKLSRQVFGASVAIGLVLFAVGLKPLGKGLVLGSLFSVLNFVIMAQVLPHQVGLTRRKATVFAFFSIFLRFGLMAVPLIVAMKMDSFHWVGVTLGLFAVPVGLFLNQWIGRKFFSKGMHL